MVALTWVTSSGLDPEVSQTCSTHFHSMHHKQPGTNLQRMFRDHSSPASLGTKQLALKKTKKQLVLRRLCPLRASSEMFVAEFQVATFFSLTDGVHPTFVLQSRSGMSSNLGFQ